jgi:hypothetical protein
VHRLLPAAGGVAIPAAQDPGERSVRSARRRPVDLVWRGAAHISPQPPGNGWSRVDAALPPSAVTRTSVQDPPPVDPARIAKAAALKLTDFDPGLVEQLTEDVIRRVDRRVRIERERRGL